MSEDYAQYVKEMLRSPEYFGHHCELPLYEPGGYGNTGLSICRDSEALARSNWRVIIADLAEFFPYHHWQEKEAGDFGRHARPPFVILRSGHWAVGWVEELFVDTENEAALKAVIDWANRLEDYPCADEEDYSQLEWEEEQEAKEWNGTNDESEETTEGA
jgi:hypothetical protein